MRRRTFALAATGGALLLPACGAPLGHWWNGLFVRGPRPPMGTNLSGMEWTQPNLRSGQSTAPNLNYTVPRRADVAYLASNGFAKNRLPIQWELLQPMLHDTRADAQARALIGEAGAFHSGYAQQITDVLDAHAAAGTTCILDLHNYGRYRDFRFQPDGSVVGLTQPADPRIRPYTSDGSQVQERIFALAPGATLTPAHFADFWNRAARRWKGHPGLGGWGLMNEPHDLPRPGQTESASEGEDLTIWPAFARAAIDAIRAVDRDGLIYVAGNVWSSAMAMPTHNPGFPLAGDNLIYEVHMYLDAKSSGHNFDYPTEVARNFSAGAGRGPIHPGTGVERLAPAVRWARANGVKLALTEIGMPIDDARWQEMYARAVRYAWQSGCEVYSWMGGAHWAARNFALNHVPGWHQNRTLEPEVSGPMKAAAGIARATIYDDGPGWGLGRPVTITVYARGNLSSPLVLRVGSDNGGSFSRTTLTLPAGPNGADSFTFTPAPDRVATLSYSSPWGHQVPPPRKVYSLADPVAHAAINLREAAHAILARYRACKWEMADGHTDFVLGQPCGEGQPLRAVSDSGFGSSLGNAMEMLNFLNKDGALSGDMKVPVMRTVGGRKASDHSAPDTWGLWCKKTVPEPGVQPNPRNRTPYDLHDEHFVIAAVSVPQRQHQGVVFQASKAEDKHAAELTMDANRPQARWLDAQGQEVLLASPAPLAPGVPAVVSMTCVPGAQALRVNSAVVARGQAVLAPSPLNQMLIGWGFVHYYPRAGFGGHVFAVVTGRGRPTISELAVLERYLAGAAGLNLGRAPARRS